MKRLKKNLPKRSETGHDMALLRRKLHGSSFSHAHEASHPTGSRPLQRPYRWNGVEVALAHIESLIWQGLARRHSEIDSGCRGSCPGSLFAKGGSRGRSRCREEFSRTPECGLEVWWRRAEGLCFSFSFFLVLPHISRTRIRVRRGASDT
jgi:hypothetical protein